MYGGNNNLHHQYSGISQQVQIETNRAGFALIFYLHLLSKTASEKAFLIGRGIKYHYCLAYLSVVFVIR